MFSFYERESLWTRKHWFHQLLGASQISTQRTDLVFPVNTVVCKKIWAKCFFKLWHCDGIEDEAYICDCAKLKGLKEVWLWFNNVGIIVVIWWTRKHCVLEYAIGHDLIEQVSNAFFSSLLTYNKVICDDTIARSCMLWTLLTKKWQWT